MRFIIDSKASYQKLIDHLNNADDNTLEITEWKLDAKALNTKDWENLNSALNNARGRIAYFKTPKGILSPHLIRVFNEFFEGNAYLKTLDLSATDFTPEQFKVVIDSLTECEALETLQLSCPKDVKKAELIKILLGNLTICNSINSMMIRDVVLDRTACSKLNILLNSNSTLRNIELQDIQLQVDRATEDGHAVQLLQLLEIGVSKTTATINYQFSKTCPTVITTLGKKDKKQEAEQVERRTYTEYLTSQFQPIINKHNAACSEDKEVKEPGPDGKKLSLATTTELETAKKIRHNRYNKDRVKKELKHFEKLIASLTLNKNKAAPFYQENGITITDLISAIYIVINTLWHYQNTKSITQGVVGKLAKGNKSEQEMAGLKLRVNKLLENLKIILHKLHNQAVDTPHTNADIIIDIFRILNVVLDDKKSLFKDYKNSTVEKVLKEIKNNLEKCFSKSQESMHNLSGELQTHIARLRTDNNAENTGPLPIPYFKQADAPLPEQEPPLPSSFARSMSALAEHGTTATVQPPTKRPPPPPPSARKVDEEDLSQKEEEKSTDESSVPQAPSAPAMPITDEDKQSAPMSNKEGTPAMLMSRHGVHKKKSSSEQTPSLQASLAAALTRMGKAIYDYDNPEEDDKNWAPTPPGSPPLPS